MENIFDLRLIRPFYCSRAYNRACGKRVFTPGDEAIKIPPQINSQARIFFIECLEGIGPGGRERHQHERGAEKGEIFFEVYCFHHFHVGVRYFPELVHHEGDWY